MKKKTVENIKSGIGIVLFLLFLIWGQREYHRKEAEREAAWEAKYKDMPFLLDAPDEQMRREQKRKALLKRKAELEAKRDM